jgi:tRNA 2-selenouridine synthase
MIHQLDAAEFLAAAKDHLILDVRSEGEYQYGHIPGATSLPLFNNEERAIVGTLYKQKGRNEAIIAGLDIAAKKLSEFVRFAQPLIQDNKVFIHCWRGGMRSGNMAWLFNLLSYEVYVLKGGYKAYRHHVLAWLARPANYHIIGGRTGSGKTALLDALARHGEQVIDLEALANHRGSSFGALGLPAQPSTEHFENLLAQQLYSLDLQRRIWMEDESRNIGTVFLDLNFWNQMRVAPLFAIELPLEVRLKRLVEEYGSQSRKGLEEAIRRISRRLGTEAMNKAIAALYDGNMEEVARICLHYYDKAYDRGLKEKETKQKVSLAFGHDDLNEIAYCLKSDNFTAKI